MNNLLFAGFALVVLTGTVFPLLVEALQNKQITVGEPYFTRLGVPIGIALLFLMADRPGAAVARRERAVVARPLC